MHSACNALPSPSDFERITANQFQSIRDIDADLEETQCAPDPAAFTNPGAIAMAAHGPEWISKGARMEVCGQYGCVRHCKHGHILRTEVFTCGSNFAPCCCDQYRFKKLKKLERVIEYVTSNEGYRDSRWVLLEIQIPAPRDRTTIEALFDSLKGSVAEMQSEEHLRHCKCEDHKYSPDPYWEFCPGYIGNQLVFRVLISDMDGRLSAKISTDRWKLLWSKWSVRVTVGKHLGFRGAFSQLLAPLKLEDPTDYAEHEVLFQGMRRFRGHNVRHLSPNIPTASEHLARDCQDSELLVEDTTNNSPESPALPNLQQPKANSAPPCPVCGCPCDQLSGSKRIGSREMLETVAQIRGLMHMLQPPG